MMREFCRLGLGLLVALAVAPAHANDAPSVELFGGYAHLRSDDDGLNGFHGSADWNPSSWVGIAADVSGQYATLGGVDVSSLSFLIGPRVSRRGGSVRPFAHALVGGVRTSGGIEVLGVSISERSTDLGGAVGGGVDVGSSERWAVRVQADYLAVRSNGETEGDPRISAGVVLKLGR